MLPILNIGCLIEILCGNLKILQIFILQNKAIYTKYKFYFSSYWNSIHFPRYTIYK